MVRVLHVLGNTSLGGAESRVMDMFRHMDRGRVQFDFLIHTKEQGFYDDEIEKLGGHIYHVPRFKVVNIIEYKKALNDFFINHKEYQIVQGHMTSTASIYLPIAKKQGVPVTIAHARSAGVDPGIKGVITKWLRRNLAQKADFLFTCSELAGEAVFGTQAVKQGRTIMIPNAITTENFLFNADRRIKMRTKLSLQDKFVIGHVGRFHYAKNHEFLLRIFKEIVDSNPNSFLILLGEGPLMEAVKSEARQLNLEDKILFAGNKDNTGDYYQAMDYFIFPSRFEGLPGTAIEAQAAGLHCLVSNTIAKEVMISENIKQMPITESPHKWAEAVLEDKEYERTDMLKCVQNSGFDATLQAEKMMKFYETGEFVL